MDERVDAKATATRLRMRELAKKFLERSASDIEAMRQAFARTSAGQPDALADIHHLAHRMNGTGATLGFDGLGDIAAQLENLVEAVQGATPPDAATLTSIRHCLEALAAELKRLATLPGS